MSINLECPLRAISLGFERENLARPQEFDFSAWAEEFGAGVPQLLFQRPGETQPYPVLLTVDGTVATWTPDATDTAIVGEGRAQLSYTVDETVVKNMIFSVVINPSLGAGGDPPEPYETWLEELTELAADTQAAAIAAGESETAAGNSATAANNAKLAAQAAQTAAETAQGKAETAQQKAEGAQAGAVIAQGKAEDASSAAEGYAANAYSYMGGAADSADAASGSAEQAVNAKNAAQAAQAAIENMTASASMGNVSVGTPSVSVVKSTVGGHENLDFTFYNLRGQKGDQGNQGVQGERGPTGPSGQDGYSPTVTVTDITGGHQVTITDRDGANTFNVMDGSVGDIDAGDVAYDDAETYPVDTVGAEISGVKSALNSKQTAPAAAGTAGQVLGLDSNLDPAWITPSSGGVSDVQVNGTSVVTSGVANVPLSTDTVPGVVMGDGYYGVETIKTGTAKGKLQIVVPTDAQVKAGANGYRPITPSKQHQSTFYGLAKAAGDTTQKDSANAVGTYTESAKSAINSMLDAPESVSGTTPTIAAKSGVRYVCGEVSTLTVTLPASGIVDVVFKSGSTATVLTVTPPTGATLSWANGFDPTSLDASTTYELNIMAMSATEFLGVCGSWT